MTYDAIDDTVWSKIINKVYNQVGQKARIYISGYILKQISKNINHPVLEIFPYTIIIK